MIFWKTIGQIFYPKLLRVGKILLMRKGPLVQR
jgi:hypothetical protein